MANFPFYHGITLAQGAHVENLVVERVAADPVPAEAGRIWFNTTDKKFRQATLDATGAVTTLSFASEEDLVASIQEALAAEVTARTAADATLQANIDAEATARAAADTTLSINLASEVTARTAADATLQAAIDAEVTARQTAITIEASARIASDTTLQAAIDAEALAREAADATLQSNLDAEATARAAADATLTTNLAAEVTRATAAEATLQSALDAEVTARAAADATIQAAINALGNAFNYVAVLPGGPDTADAFDLSILDADGKNPGDYYKVFIAGYFKVGDAGTPFYANANDGLVWNRNGGVDKIDNTNSNVAGTTDFIEVTGSADTGFVVDVAAAFKTRVSDLETAGAAEATARAAADVTLQANIDAEAAARSAADATLQANIDAEATARAAGDTAVMAAYNATIWTYESDEAATTHVLAHNLASPFVDFSIMIRRADGSWYNDIASIVVNTPNQATLYLTTALNVRVIARSAAQLP